jgi:hypothetical protein
MMQRSYELADWRDVGKILALIHRFGFQLARLDLDQQTSGYAARVEISGGLSEGIARLDAQIHRVLADAKEMAR